MHVGKNNPRFEYKMSGVTLTVVEEEKDIQDERWMAPDESQSAPTPRWSPRAACNVFIMPLLEAQESSTKVK